MTILFLYLSFFLSFSSYSLIETILINPPFSYSFPVRPTFLPQVEVIEAEPYILSREEEEEEIKDNLALIDYALTVRPHSPRLLHLKSMLIKQSLHNTENISQDVQNNENVDTNDMDADENNKNEEMQNIRIP